MKPNNFLVLLKRFTVITLVLFCLSCSKDKSPATSAPPPPPPPPPPPVVACASCQLLYIGGDPVDAPTLSADRYEVAARYTPAKIGSLVGKTIKEIRFFLAEKPDSIVVKLYGPNNATTPGELLYQAEVTSAAERNKWNVHTLPKTVMLKNEDIWLSIAFKLTFSSKTVGCDLGPALPDGDWIYKSSTGNWSPLHISAQDINWTIRLNVE